MRLIHIDQYNPETMQLGKPIYDKHKRVLLASGRSIHFKLLKRIKEMNIKHLIVEDAESKGITLDEMLDMPTWIDAIQVIEKVFKEEKKMFKSHTIQILHKLVTKLIVESTRRSALMLIPSSAMTSENQLYAHSINVALLALQMGKNLHYNHSQLKELAMGCLLHDIGKKIADDKSHAELGFDILRYNRDISLLSAHIAYQHHETIDGKGYPRGLLKVHDYAQICGVADFYEHNISKDHVLPHNAVEQLMAKSDMIYSQRIIQAFTSSVPSYFPGTKIVLNDGTRAIVTRVDLDLHRPTIRIESTEKELSLVDFPTLMITNVLNVK